MVETRWVIMAKKLLGIHIDDRRIICVEAKVSGSVAIEKIATSTLPDNCIANGFITDFNAAYGALDMLIHKTETVATEAIIDVPTNLAYMKFIPFENGYLSATNDQLLWEISMHTGTTDAGKISFFHQAKTTCLIAAKNENIKTRAALVEKAGISVLSAVPSSLALFNFISYLESFKNKRNIALIDVETPFSTIVFYVQGEFFTNGSTYTPPELFGFGFGKTTWGEFSENIVEAVKLALKALTKLYPTGAPEMILFSGRPIPMEASSAIAQSLGAKVVDIELLMKKKFGTKPKKAGLSFAELALATALVVNGIGK